MKGRVKQWSNEGANSSLCAERVESLEDRQRREADGRRMLVSKAGRRLSEARRRDECRDIYMKYKFRMKWRKAKIIWAGCLHVVLTLKQTGGTGVWLDDSSAYIINPITTRIHNSSWKMEFVREGTQVHNNTHSKLKNPPPHSHSHSFRQSTAWPCLLRCRLKTHCYGDGAGALPKVTEMIYRKRFILCGWPWGEGSSQITAAPKGPQGLSILRKLLLAAA